MSSDSDLTSSVSAIWPDLTGLIVPLMPQTTHPVQGLLIAEHTPKTAGWPGQWQVFTPASLVTLPFTARADLALYVLPETSLETTAGTTIQNGLTRLRDLLARRLLVAARPHHSAALRALGLACVDQGIYQDQPWAIWQFNILDYKPVPDWFNSKFWANPENWDKYRW